jgi:hypothetical protein
MEGLSCGEQKSLIEIMVQAFVNKWLFSEGMFLQFIWIK